MSLDNVKLSIKNLDLFYGDNQALKDINIKKESRSKKIIYCLMKIKSVYGILFLQKVKEKKVKN